MSPDKNDYNERMKRIEETVELIANMQLKTEKTINRLGKYIRIIVQDHEARLAALENGDSDE